MMREFVFEIGGHLLSALGLLLSLVVVCLMAVVVAMRWPFQLGSWLLEKVLRGLAVIGVLAEGL